MEGSAGPPCSGTWDSASPSPWVGQGRVAGMASAYLTVVSNSKGKMMSWWWHLANEAALGAQVTVVDVLGGKLIRALRKPSYTVRDLWRASAGRQGLLRGQAKPEAVCKTWPAAPPGTLPGALYPKRSPLGQENFRERGRARQACSPCAQKNPLSPPSRKGERNVPNPSPSLRPRSLEGAEPQIPGFVVVPVPAGQGLGHCPRKRRWPDSHSELLKG